jgi:hypothetical protein
MISATGASVTIPSAVGGSAVGSHGVNMTGASTLTVTLAKGGTVLGALGVAATLGMVILNGTDLTGTGYPVGITAAILEVKPGVKLAYDNTAPALVTFYDPTLLPAQADVLNGVHYGGGDFMGSASGGGSNTGRVIGG